MPAGIQCFDSSGNLVVDITARLSRYSGSSSVSGSAGAVSVAGTGTIWFAFQPTLIWGFINMDVTRPIFTVSGTTLSWSYSAPATGNNTKVTGTVFYGVY